MQKSEGKGGRKTAPQTIPVVTRQGKTISTQEIPLPMVNGKVKMTGKVEGGLHLYPRFTVLGKSAGSICYGCGGLISSSEETKQAGGVSGEIVAMTKSQVMKFKRMQQNLTTKKALCNRCRALSRLEKEGGEGAERAAQKLSVVDADPINADIFANHVGKIQHSRSWAVHVCDATDFDSSIIRGARNYVGKNPLVLAVTKCDLLPVDVSEHNISLKLKSWFRERCRQKGLNCHDVFLLSGKYEKGIKDLVDFIHKQLNGKNVYMFGNANVGKSTLVNAFSNDVLERESFKSRMARRRRDVVSKTSTTASNLPGTTLFSIRVPCFKSHKHALFDTPGLFPHRYKWPLPMTVSSEPSMLTPKILSWPGHSPAAHFVIEGVPLRIEIQPLNAARVRYSLSDNDPRIVWYSNYTASKPTLISADPVLEGDEIGNKSKSISPTLENENEAERSVLPENEHEAERSAVPDKHLAADSVPEAIFVKKFIPHIDERGTYSADIVFIDLGWLAVSFTTPHEIRIYAHKAAHVTQRNCMFHPHFANQHLRYIEKFESSTPDQRLGMNKDYPKLSRPVEGEDDFPRKRGGRRGRLTEEELDFEYDDTDIYGAGGEEEFFDYEGEDDHDFLEGDSSRFNDEKKDFQRRDGKPDRFGRTGSNSFGKKNSNNKRNSQLKPKKRKVKKG